MLHSQVRTAEKLTVTEILFNDEMNNYSGKELLNELRLTMIGKEILVPTIEGNRSFINLDNAASTPTFEPVWKAVRQTWSQPKDVQQEVIEEVRSICSGVLGAPLADYDMIFTSNTTEAVNLAAESLSCESGLEAEPVVLSTMLEHTSNDLPWRMVHNVSMIRLSVDNDGFINLTELENVLREYNQKNKHGNETGKTCCYQRCFKCPWYLQSPCGNQQNRSQVWARLFVDGAQLVAHRKIEMGKWGIDYLAFSAHKVYAPFGTGVLVAAKGLLKFGPAEMELIRSSGEENTVGIAALGKSLLLLQRIGLDLIREEAS